MEKPKKSKSFFILALLIFMLGTYSILRMISIDKDISIFEGTIIGIYTEGEFTSLLVDGIFIDKNIENPAPSVIKYTLTSEAKITKNRREMMADSLAIGNYVHIEGSNMFDTSYPAGGSANIVNVLSTKTPKILINGKVLQVKEGSGTNIINFLVEGSITGYQEASQVWVSVPDSSYYPMGIRGRDAMLLPGDMVQVLISGDMDLSYPMQAESSSVIITSFAN